VPHLFAVAGLMLNLVGTVLLFWFQPTATRVFTADGHERVKWINEVNPDVWGQFRRQRRGFHIAVSFLIAGFALQLLDLIHS
jgi:hypothetical protein